MSRTKGKIRKITIGIDPVLHGMSFEVGRQHRAGGTNTATITQIVEDFEHWKNFGVKRFLVEAKEDNSTSEPFVWKEFESMPVLIEYSIPDGNEIEKV